ncbi:MAG: retropepsin-like aspartic protease [Microcoleaceae cyanobacterium]
MNDKPLFSLLSRQKLLHPTGKRLTPVSIVCLMLAGCFSFGWKATAQEYPGCFLETQEGEVVFLPEVCQYPEAETFLETGSNASSEGGVYQARILRRLNNTIPVIEAVFNNQQSFEMLLDTGASNTVITPIMAEFLGVIPAGTERANTPSARGVEFDVGLVQSINVAGAVTDNVTVAIAPALDIGLLGQDIFGQYDVTIKQDVVEFRERSASPRRTQPTQPNANPQSEPVGEPSQPFENRPVGEPSQPFESEGSPDQPSTAPANRSTDSSDTDSPTNQPSNSSDTSSESSTGESSN